MKCRGLRLFQVNITVDHSARLAPEVMDLRGFSVMKTIGYVPLLTYPDATSIHAANVAVGMASAIGADVDVTVFAVDLPRAASTFGNMIINVSDMIQKVENDSREHAAALSAAVRQGALNRGLGVSLETRVAAPTEAMAGAAAEARYRDLAIIPWAEDNLTSREVAEAVIFGSGRPVLLVPQSHVAARIDHIAIAWDGSRVAARALADARGTLPGVTRITVMTAGDEKPLETGIGDQLVDSLSRRGLQARHHVVPVGNRPVSLALQEASLEVGAGVMVMGGYGHSRLRDFVMGGATKGVLAALFVPVLMSH